MNWIASQNALHGAESTTGLVGTIGETECSRKLMKREVREEELLAVLVNRRPHENGALLYGVVEAGQTARFSSAIRDYLKGDSGFGQGMFPYRTAFDTVDRTREANFTDAALEVLRRANRPGSSRSGSLQR
jgi:hypothetical protein